jgi:hypothetical protein
MVVPMNLRVAERDILLVQVAVGAQVDLLVHPMALMEEQVVFPITWMEQVAPIVAMDSRQALA